jgi:hypothetical protein
MFESDALEGPDGSLYEGFPVIRTKTGCRAVEIKTVTLASVLEGLPRTDFLHVDIQGAELAVLQATIDLITRSVRRIYIGTHSLEIEQGLRDLFGSYGWEPLTDYSLASSCQTAYGRIRFVDGIQTWLNPRSL